MTQAAAAGPGDQSGPAREQIVIKDNRKIDASGQPKGTAQSAGEPSKDTARTPAQAEETVQAEATMGHPGSENGNKGSGSTAEPVDAEIVTGEIVDEDPGTSGDGSAAEAVPGTNGPGKNGDASQPSELEALRSELDERLRDLQRVTAEYANYRKRVDRDRSAVVEQAMGLVINALLPVLDDVDRAREHDDLVGPFAGVAEQLQAALTKFGLTGFGEVGDSFDPTRHEAVAHQTSAEVTEPTCVAVMRRGYVLGDRLLRAALVAVADPE